MVPFQLKQHIERKLLTTDVFEPGSVPPTFLAFELALRQGQFDDLDGPPVRMLFGDKEPAAKAPKAPADTHEHS